MLEEDDRVGIAPARRPRRARAAAPTPRGTGSRRGGPRYPPPPSRERQSGSAPARDAFRATRSSPRRRRSGDPVERRVLTGRAPGPKRDSSAGRATVPHLTPRRGRSGRVPVGAGRVVARGGRPRGEQIGGRHANRTPAGGSCSHRGPRSTRRSRCSSDRPARPRPGLASATVSHPACARGAPGRLSPRRFPATAASPPRDPPPARRRSSRSSLLSERGHSQLSWLNASSAAFTQAKGRDFTRGKGRPSGPWVSIGPSSAVCPTSSSTRATPRAVRAERVPRSPSRINDNRDRADLPPPGSCRMWIGPGRRRRLAHGQRSGGHSPSVDLSDRLVRNNAIGSILVDPTDPTGNTVYVGTGEANAWATGGGHRHLQVDRRRRHVDAGPG